MKTKEEIKKQLVQEQDELQMIEAEKTSNFEGDIIVKQQVIAMQKSKISLLEWILEDSEVEEPKVEYVVKATYEGGIAEFFAYHDDEHREAFWVENTQAAKKFDSKEEAKEFVIGLWGYIPNWFSFEEYKN